MRYMAKAVKLADIAERLNVSTVTVSKALSGQKGVSEEMRARIKQLADELGYVPPSAGKRIKEQKNYTIGVIIAERFLEKYSSFYWQLYQKVADRAIARGCFTIFETITGQEEKELSLPKIVREKKAHGLIVIGQMDTEYLRTLEEEGGMPVVYLDFYDKKKECDTVISDNFYGMYRLVNYLFEMGHKEIAYVGTLLATNSITDRYFGYAKSLMEHGQQVREDWIIDDRSMATGRIDEEKLLMLPEEMPTAFVCCCDLTASKIVKKLNAAGYRVPEDISVVGYDNYLYPGLCDVGITTYEVDMKEMARRVIHAIVHKISGDTYRKGVFVVEGHIVYKESVLSR